MLRILESISTFDRWFPWVECGALEISDRTFKAGSDDFRILVKVIEILRSQVAAVSVIQDFLWTTVCLSGISQSS